MPMKIVDDCTSCAACEEDCPTDAIVRGDDIFEIKLELCTDCAGEYDAPKCLELCPVDGAIVVAAVA
jgi:ferredoxin